jgi:hypothetical protein
MTNLNGLITDAEDMFDEMLDEGSQEWCDALNDFAFGTISREQLHTALDRYLGVLKPTSQA